ncbi:hypothetical protein DFH94DRAFT_370100 [Russula ochroleuca]|jgi:hypothetical protein|uniref:Uncharacterized protein n=1 Tax=Russula ochroleuca TaxID=152965 RepID=A0A9P5TB80_9AGAM|nr:hypothetical protein DFH94DRAFT_370100 [Russula ochroleuca]
MTGDVQKALILVAQIFTNEFDMGDSLRNNVVFLITGIQQGRGKRTTFGSIMSRNTEIERSKVFVQMFVRSCGQWVEPLTTRANKNAVAKGTTDDNIDTHHATRKDREKWISSRRVYVRYVEIKNSEGVRYTSLFASSRTRVAELKIKIGSLKLTEDGHELMVTILSHMFIYETEHGHQPNVAQDGRGWLESAEARWHGACAIKTRSKKIRARKLE